MNKEQIDTVVKLLDEHLSEALQSESPQKRALLRALAPMAVEGLNPLYMHSESARVAASRLLFEVVGLIGKGQKSAPPTKDSST
jgi:hypothetical protein